MARSDLILSIVRSGSKGDSGHFRRSVEALIAEERAKQHHVFAERLETAVKDSGANGAQVAMSQWNTSNGSPLWLEGQPRLTLNSLVLPSHVTAACREVVEEQQRAELLRAHGIEPRHRMLVTGPPGNGKTSLAEALAEALMLPLIIPRYDAIIGSYLGETASRLRKLFDYVRTRPCVVFLDEFDTLGRERGDVNETGEIKRVVSSLLLQVDALPSYNLAIVATNHPETLDRAVWRRFQIRLELPQPSLRQAREWFEQWSSLHRIPLGLSPKVLAEKLRARSFSELEDFCQDVRRRLVLKGPDADVRSVFKERLEQWVKRVDRPREED